MMISRPLSGVAMSAFLVATIGVRAAVPALLDEAVQKVFRDTDRWAYTQELVKKDAKGKTLTAAVVRFDPSKPYAQQYTPLLIDGKPPVAADLKEYQRKGEKRGKTLEKDGTDKVQKTVGELMDIENARVTEE